MKIESGRKLCSDSTKPIAAREPLVDRAMTGGQRLHYIVNCWPPGLLKIHERAVFVEQDRPNCLAVSTRVIFEDALESIPEDRARNSSTVFSACESARSMPLRRTFTNVGPIDLPQFVKQLYRGRGRIDDGRSTEPATPAPLTHGPPPRPRVVETAAIDISFAIGSGSGPNETGCTPAASTITGTSTANSAGRFGMTPWL